MTEKLRPNTTERLRPIALTTATALTGLALLALAACGGGGRTDTGGDEPTPLPSPTSTKQVITEKNLGFMWPLTVDRGTAECRKGGQAVITVPDGTTYALNDRARKAGYDDVAPVRASGEGGDKVSLGVLLSRTMKLCGTT
ncbi:DUF2511 domain-containing protein [Streptomyces sp. NPDC059010]|uniref:DUF2511 domain-containing protein n=1 Tax=Streptomyces sp. NPDC059010 TaxID=3346695 RepID=UPI00367A91DB